MPMTSEGMKRRVVKIKARHLQPEPASHRLKLRNGGKGGSSSTEGRSRLGYTPFEQQPEGWQSPKLISVKPENHS